jgi:hypothetical protein
MTPKLPKPTGPKPPAPPRGPLGRPKGRPAWLKGVSVNQGDVNVCCLIEEAAAKGWRFTSHYKGASCQLLPLAIGMMHDQLYLWAYRVACGDSDEPAYGCFRVADFSSVTPVKGEMSPPDDAPGPGTCIDAVLRRFN